MAVKKSISDVAYIVRFVPREDDHPSLKGSELELDPLFHIEKSSGYEAVADDIRKSALCTGLDQDYKNKIIDTTSFLVGLYTIDKKYREFLSGFMIVELKKSGTLYLEMICTQTADYRGIGTLLMDYLDKIKAAIGSKKLMLWAVPEAIDFYKKLGYKKRKTMRLSGFEIPNNVDPNYHSTRLMTKRNRSRSRSRNRSRDNSRTLTRRQRRNSYSRN